MTLRLEYDWRYAPDAEPAGMAVFFYNDSTRRMTRVDFSNRFGGSLSLPEGNYRLITYNNDCEVSQFDMHHDFGAHMAYTRQGHVLEPVAGPQSPQPEDGETVVVCPDEIYGCSALEIEVTQTGVTYTCVSFEEKEPWVGLPVISEEHVITLFPHDLLCHYSYEVRHVEGLDRIERMCGAISGMSPSLTMSDENLHTLPVTLPFEAAKYYPAKAGDNGSIVGEFLTFGHHEDNGDPHRMSFYLWMTDGSKYKLGPGLENFDVTLQVHAAPDRRRVHLVIDTVRLPSTPTVTPQQGLYPGADDWIELNTDIEV